MGNSLRKLDGELCAKELARMNETTERYGLSLSPRDIEAVLASREEALAETGRVEFGTGVLAKLAYALCDSPYIQKDDYVETLCGMQRLFYHFKALYMERASDDVIIKRMTRRYNGECRGCLELLTDIGLGGAQ